jgi:hypothetical protein
MKDYFMRQAFLIIFFILTFNFADAQSGAGYHDTTISYRTKIENDTCRVFIKSVINDSLTAKVWLIRKNKKIWETTLQKSKFRAPFYEFVDRRKADTAGLSENKINRGFMTSKELKSLNFDNLVFEGFAFHAIRSSRLHYEAIFRDKKTKQRYLLLPGIMYDDEKEIRKRKKQAIVVFGILKMK